jgi:hypothetical protein
MRPHNRRVPVIDETRVWSTEARQKVIQPRGLGMAKHRHPTDISPEEIERRYQARLAELRYLRSLGVSL